MIKSKTKLFLIVVVLIFILIGVFYLFNIKNRRSSQESTVLLKTPDIPQRISSTFTITSQLNKGDIKIPLSLPVYSVNNTSLPFVQVTGIAKALGFNSDPQRLNDVNFGVIYDWTNSIGYELRAIPSNHVLDYKLSLQSLPIGGIFPADSELTTIARNFLQENSFLLRSEEHTSELQSPDHLVCRLLLEK